MHTRGIRGMVALAWLTVALGTMPESATADFRFGLPTNMGSAINSPASDTSACLSADGLELYFVSDRPGGFGEGDLWVSTRQSVHDPWGPPTNLGATVNSPYADCYPSLSSDGLTLYFSDYVYVTPRPGGLGGRDIWMTTRPSRNVPWTTPVNLGAPINASSHDFCPAISGDGLTLVFTSDRSGGLGSWDLWMATRASVQDPWGPPVNLGPAVNGSGWDGEGGLSWDGRALFFGSQRGGLVGAIDLWMTTRKTLADPWGGFICLGPVVNSSSNDGSGTVSPDMRTLYFCSDRPGGFGSYDLYEAPIMPAVDFDGNETVDIQDLERLIESWGQDDPVVDVGPAPWGDGIVDAADLEVLMSYWGQEIPSPDLIARWKLDETEGTVAVDSAGGNDGTVTGIPLWQADGGQVDGALELDGASSVVTDFVLNPSKGPFSVFAWVKDGAPGQVILSQDKGANWLLAGAPTGALTTELKSARGQPLASAAIVTDGVWHHVGVVRNGKDRILYVDDVEVARDTAASLTDAMGGLYIGVGSTLAPGTFWSGLIDDVRIYDCVLRP